MWLSWFLAALPILVVLVLMLVFRRSAALAGSVGWLTALGLALTAFGAEGRVLGYAQGKAILLALYVLYVIWMALLFYYTIKEGGVIQTLTARLPALTTDRALQALLLAWALGAFIESVTGFGLPVAIIAPLLVSLGFEAVTAVVMVSIGQAWAVTFGGLATALHALEAASGYPVSVLAGPTAFLLGLACFGCGAGVLWTLGGWETLKKNLGRVVGLGLGMSLTYYGLALTPLYRLAAMGSGAVGLGLTVWLARRQNHRQTRPAPAAAPAAPPLPLWLAFTPYALLVFIVIITQLIRPLQTALDGVMLQIPFPELVTPLKTTPAGLGRTISLFGHSGALLAYATLASFGLFSLRRCYPDGLRVTAQRIGQATLKSSLPLSIGILTMVAMSVTMEHAGMTLLLAQGLSRLAGAAFPLVSPFIGMLGAFMTGSNTNSNVIFASLQVEAARLLTLSPTLILAAQTTGGSIGGAFAPAKVLLGCSTVGLTGQEARALKPIMLQGLLILAGIGLVVWVLAR